jgi:hypothetical protein
VREIDTPLGSLRPLDAPTADPEACPGCGKPFWAPLLCDECEEEFWGFGSLALEAIDRLAA